MAGEHKTQHGYTVRAADTYDREQILILYKKVSCKAGGIARLANEITPGYVGYFCERAAENGIQLVAENAAGGGEIIGEIHAYKLLPLVFNHVLSELTIVVDPFFHHKGIGTLLIKRLLEIAGRERNDILRVELVARESNINAIELYKKTGFLTEGRFERRIYSHNGLFEADIPMAWFNVNYKRPCDFLD